LPFDLGIVYYGTAYIIGGERGDFSDIKDKEGIRISKFKKPIRVPK
jgi:hypothetical protein